MSNHKPDAAQFNPYRVCRHILVTAFTPQTLQRLNAECEHEYGLEAFLPGPKSGQLVVHYDASQVDLDQVEALLKTHQLQLRQGWWPRLRNGWYRFVDQNVRDNARHEPWCCHKLPPRSGKPR
ncbi:MAG: cation transporter [Alcanivorax sp.]|nr:cation transporter [Alcanivorax sp.]